MGGLDGMHFPLHLISQFFIFLWETRKLETSRIKRNFISKATVIEGIFEFFYVYLQPPAQWRFTYSNPLPVVVSLMAFTTSCSCQ